MEKINMKMKKPSKRGAPKGNKNAAKGETERLPWRMPVEWGIRAAIEQAAKATKMKPAEVLRGMVQGAKPPPLPCPGWRLLEGNELPVVGDKGYRHEELGWETLDVPALWLAGGERIEGVFFARKTEGAGQAK